MRFRRDVLETPLDGVRAGRRKLPDEHFIKDDSERVEVAASVHRTNHTIRLLRCDVCARRSVDVSAGLRDIGVRVGSGGGASPTEEYGA